MAELIAETCSLILPLAVSGQDRLPACCDAFQRETESAAKQSAAAAAATAAEARLNVLLFWQLRDRYGVFCNLSFWQ